VGKGSKKAHSADEDGYSAFLNFYLGVRQDVSLLLEHGHGSNAKRYPVAVVWSEARIIRRRKNTEQNDYLVGMNLVISAVLNPKKGHSALKKHLKRLEGND
jgi:hypothetical protein